MKVKTSIKHGTKYVYAKLGAIVVAIQQVAVVKGLAMWEVERVSGAGPKKRLIVSARALMPLPVAVGAN